MNERRGRRVFCAVGVEAWRDKKGEKQAFVGTPTENRIKNDLFFVRLSVYDFNVRIWYRNIDTRQAQPFLELQC